MTDEWREALHPLGTGHVKEHMTDAPWIVVLSAEKYGLNPMGFLRELLGRGTSEKAVLVMPVGYSRADAKVPDLQRLPLDRIVQWNAVG